MANKRGKKFICSFIFGIVETPTKFTEGNASASQTQWLIIGEKKSRAQSDSSLQELHKIIRF
jgi:hypothetical protein